VLFDALIEPGLRFTTWLQLASPALDLPMLAVTWLGALEFYLVLLPFIYWTLSPALATRTFAVVLLGDAVNNIFKVCWHQPRPYWVGGAAGVVGMATEGSYGVPSGHAGGSLLTWGYLATQLRARWFTGLAVVLVLLIGISRPYLGVHFAHDVAFGWALGGVVLLFAVTLQDRVALWLHGLTPPKYLLVAAALAVSLMAIGLLLPLLIAGAPDAPQWAHFATEARSPAHFFALAGALFGLMLGYRRQTRTLRYAPSPDWMRRISCFAFGMAGLLLVYVGLGLLFRLLAEHGSLASFLLRFVRFVAVAWWITDTAPRLFVRFRLARTQ
jgi:membrane-associated phospholipid phosphatase